MLISVLFQVACSSGPSPKRPTESLSPEPEIAGKELVSPLEGYPLTLPQEIELRLLAAFGVLKSTADALPVRAAAEALLREDPGLHPANVLLAQIDLREGAADPARQRLEPIAEELPTYRAAQLLLAEATEELGDMAAAYRALVQVAEGDRELTNRAVDLRPVALEQVRGRLAEDLERGHLDKAQARLSQLETWAPEDTATLEAAWRVAAAIEDDENELLAARRLWKRRSETSETWTEMPVWNAPADGLQRRLAELEVSVGDIRLGMDHLSEMVAAAPDDSVLRDRAEYAKFVWRLRSLPPEVQVLARQSELTRADFATLIYWLVPQVRYAQLNSPPIASDILDHPKRDQIVRVLNLDLLRIDETLHRFDPDSRLTRAAALSALVVLVEQGRGDAACLADVGTGWRNPYSVCQIAARCRLIAESADCLPQSGVSGAELLELMRRALDLEAAR